jgi:hypothetical protein
MGGLEVRDWPDGARKKDRDSAFGPYFKEKRPFVRIYPIKRAALQGGRLAMKLKRGFRSGD